VVAAASAAVAAVQRAACSQIVVEGVMLLQLFTYRVWMCRFILGALEVLVSISLIVKCVVSGCRSCDGFQLTSSANYSLHVTRSVGMLVVYSFLTILHAALMMTLLSVFAFTFYHDEDSTCLKELYPPAPPPPPASPAPPDRVYGAVEGNRPGTMAEVECCYKCILGVAAGAAIYVLVLASRARLCRLAQRAHRLSTRRQQLEDQALQGGEGEELVKVVYHLIAVEGMTEEVASGRPAALVQPDGQECMATPEDFAQYSPSPTSAGRSPGTPAGGSAQDAVLSAAAHDASA